MIRDGAWLNASLEGYCAITCPEQAQPAAQLCRHADKGSFTLSAVSKTWRAAVHECLDHCKRCSRCRFISVSLEFRDCSWFETCPETHTDISSFRSGLAVAGTAPGTGISGPGVAAPPSAASDDGPVASSSEADSSPCFVALGIMSAPGMHERRRVSRATWMRHRAPGVQVRFMLRASSLRDRRLVNGTRRGGQLAPYTSADQQRVALERRQERDLWILQLDEGPELHPDAGHSADVLRGRVLTLQAWLRLTRRRLPSDRYVTVT